MLITTAYLTLSLLAADPFVFNAQTQKCEGFNVGIVGACGDLGEGADLKGADLRGKDLRGAYLARADLRGADLRGADLRKAQLSGADLTGADLRGARIDGAYLFKANLTAADLRGLAFNLRLRGADLARVTLTGAVFDEATELPFSREQALRRAMVLVPAASPSAPVASTQSERQ